MSDLVQTAALSTVKRVAETARTTLGQTPLGAAPVEDVVARLHTATMQLHAAKSAVTEGALRYQVVRPVLVPANAADIPEFLRTRKEADMLDADAVAEARGRQLVLVSSVEDYNNSCDALAKEFDAAARAAIQATRRSSASVMSALTALAASRGRS